MRHASLFLPALLLAAAAARADDADPYLTKEGRLAQAVDVLDVQGGFAGFTGTAWTVEPTGKWVVYSVRNQERTATANGELSKEQLAALAKELARYKAADLNDEGKPVTNPRVVTVRWGKKSAVLNLGTTEPLPKPDEKSVAGRYAGVAAAVKAAAVAPKKGEK